MRSIDGVGSGQRTHYDRAHAIKKRPPSGDAETLARLGHSCRKLSMLVRTDSASLTLKGYVPATAPPPERSAGTASARVKKCRLIVHSLFVATSAWWPPAVAQGLV
jgi:hypothetical protein